MLSKLSNDEIGFGPWVIEPAERRLSCAGRTVELTPRYFDALLLLTRNPGQLIAKDRFMAEVWQGVPVTDEALTQCIRSLRRLLGDDAGKPRFIQTVPRHGYRFIGAVKLPALSSCAAIRPIDERNGALLLIAAGLMGGAAAGLAGGLGYGLLAANDPPVGTGAISVVLVLTCLCLLVGLLGGAGIAAGVALARQFDRNRLLSTMLGGALGGLVVGAIGRLLGVDTFTLLVGSRPIAITGGSEGLLIGAIAGAAAWLALRGPAPLGRVAMAGAAFGALAGILVAVGGGQMMAGSLVVLAAAHPNAPLGSIIGSAPLPWSARLASAAVEGATFVGALSLAFALLQKSTRS